MIGNSKKQTKEETKKHRKYAISTTDENLTEYFKEGNIDAILNVFADQLKETTGYHKKQKKGLLYGPLPKNQATVDFEDIIAQLLDPDKSKDMQFGYDSKTNKYLVQIGEKILDFTYILQNMDPRFLQFDEDLKDKYVKQFYGRINEHERFKDFDVKDPKYRDMHFGEVKALHEYTTQFYGLMNGLLRGQTPKDLSEKICFLAKCFIDVDRFSSAMRYLLLNTAMGLSGLNKNPDHNVKYCFRGESMDSKQRFDARIASMASPDVVTVENGFVSTSKDALGFFGGNCFVMYYDVFGKDIEAYSDHPAEHEFLIPPTQVKWVGHKIFQDGHESKHFFIAKPVYTLSGLNPDQNNLRITTSMATKLLEDVLKVKKKVMHSESVNLEEIAKVKELGKYAKKLLKNEDLSYQSKYKLMMEKLQSVDQKVTKKPSKVLRFFHASTKKNSPTEMEVENHLCRKLKSASLNNVEDGEKVKEIDKSKKKGV